MKIRRKKAAATTATQKKIVQRGKSYLKEQNPSTENHRAKRIRKHRADIPTIHRKTYDQAMQGKSMKSAIKSFCLECAYWQKEEVRLCTSLACPLYPYRPYRKKNQASQGPGFGAVATIDSRKGEMVCV